MNDRIPFFLVVACMLYATVALSQTDWVKHPDNPVFQRGEPGSWDDSRLGPDQVIEEYGMYRMWYTGWDGISNRNFQIGLATSSNGIDGWTRHQANPVLPVGDEGEWDSWLVGNPVVMKDEGIYKMWYSGGDGTGGHRCTGYATSVDGVNWTKHDEPILEQTPDSWDSWAAHWCSVIKDGTTYKMWYSGATDFYSHRIGYATSDDGISWTKHGDNPLELQHDGSWDDAQVWFPFVVKDGDTYHMWYSGSDGSVGRIGYAWSEDGISWHPVDENPVLVPGDPGSWDDLGVNEACVMKRDDSFVMWYQGYGDPGIADVGYATEAPTGVLVDALRRGIGSHRNVPNPFNPQTTIQYDLSRQATVTLSIFDLAGHLVRTLVEGEEKPAGSHAATWTGRNSYGQSMPSGTYVYRLEAEGYSESKSMSLIR